MPRWMQNSTTRWLRGCVSSFNNRRLWYFGQVSSLHFNILHFVNMLVHTYQLTQSDSINLTYLIMSFYHCF